MQRLEVSGAVRPLYGSLGVKGLKVRPRSYAKPSCKVLIDQNDLYLQAWYHDLPALDLQKETRYPLCAARVFCYNNALLYRLPCGWI